MGKIIIIKMVYEAVRLEEFAKIDREETQGLKPRALQCLEVGKRSKYSQYRLRRNIQLWNWLHKDIGKWTGGDRSLI